MLNDAKTFVADENALVWLQLSNVKLSKRGIRRLRLSFLDKNLSHEGIQLDGLLIRRILVWTLWKVLENLGFKKI